MIVAPPFIVQCAVILLSVMCNDEMSLFCF